MNKDFFSKPISLKDINLKDFDIKKIKNKKEIVITILVIIYIIVICVIGNNLLEARSEAKSKYELKESKYTALQNSLSEAEIKKQIEEIMPVINVVVKDYIDIFHKKRYSIGRKNKKGIYICKKNLVMEK